MLAASLNHLTNKRCAAYKHVESMFFMLVTKVSRKSYLLLTLLLLQLFVLASLKPFLIDHLIEGFSAEPRILSLHSVRELKVNRYEYAYGQISYKRCYDGRCV